MEVSDIWCEKYRPSTLDQIVLNSNTRNYFNKVREDKNIPNVMFVGRPGIGKTSLAKIIVSDISQDMQGVEKNSGIYDHWADKKNKSKVHQISFDYLTGEAIVVSCFDWSDEMTKKKNWEDGLKVTILTKEMADFFVSLN